MTIELTWEKELFTGRRLIFIFVIVWGRRWQCGTIQLDFAMPEKFDLYYIGEDGNRHRPVMLHRTVLGSIERFLGILIEQFAGAFPLWLAPVQVVILPIAERHIDYAREIKDFLSGEEIRVEVNDENATLGAKIRKAEMGEGSLPCDCRRPGSGKSDTECSET